MKKYIECLCSLLCGLTLLTGCEKELMNFEGEDCLYFDVRRGAEWIEPAKWAHQFYSTVDFGNLAGNDLKVSFKVMASGMARDYDRPFVVTVNKDSTSAIAGSDYDEFDENFIIKAGESNATVSFTIHRTKRMDGDTLQLQLQIHENEYFKLKYDNYGDFEGVYSPDKNPTFDYNKNAAIHNIFIYDVLSEPKEWAGNNITGAGLFGKFSVKKFRLMMEITNTTVEDYQSKATMPNARQVAIGQQMAKYLLDKAAAKDPVLDEDGTMMYFMAIGQLGGSAAWVPFTKPEDYYK